MTTKADRDRLIYKLWYERAVTRRNCWHPTVEQIAMAVLFVADGWAVPRRWDRFLPQASREALTRIRGEVGPER